MKDHVSESLVIMRDSQRYLPQTQKFSYEVTRLSKTHQEFCAFYNTNSAVLIAMRRAHGGRLIS